MYVLKKNNVNKHLLNCLRVSTVFFCTKGKALTTLGGYGYFSFFYLLRGLSERLVSKGAISLPQNIF